MNRRLENMAVHYRTIGVLVVEHCPRELFIGGQAV
jgi:hypothetical protein